MADFKDYKKIRFEDIYQDVKDNRPEYEDTLKEQVRARKSFLSIKKAYFEKYYPEYIPKRKKEPAQHMWEIMGIDNPATKKKSKQSKA